MKTKWIAALAALSLVAAPAAAAQPTRTPTSIDEAEALGGGNAVAWIIAGLIAIAAIIYLTDDDDDDVPVSP